MKVNRLEVIQSVLLLGISVILAGCNAATATSTPFPTPAMVPSNSQTAIPLPTILIETGKEAALCPAPLSASQAIWRTVPQNTAEGWHHYWHPPGKPMQVYDLVTDEKWLWIATPQGVIRLNQLNLKYELFSHTNTSPNIVLDHVYTMAVDDQGRLWAGGKYGLVRYTGNGGWKIIYTDRPVYNFALDMDSNLWYFAFYPRTLGEAYRFHGQEPPTAGDWMPERVERVEWESLDSSHWRLRAFQDAFGGRTVRDANGDIWDYASSRELVTYHNGSGKAQSIRLPSGSISAIATANVQPGIWIGLDTGLFYSDGKITKQYQLTADKTAVSYPRVYAFAFNDDGGGWATTSEGLFYFDVEMDKWDNMAKVPLEIPIGESLLAPGQQGGLWVLAGDYLAHFDDKKWEHWPIPSEILQYDLQMLTMVEFQGSLWIGAGNNGLWCFDSRAWNKALPFPVGSLVQNRNEKLYATASLGLSVVVYDGTDWRRLPDCVECDRQNSAGPITVDATGRVWIVSGYRSGIWRYSMNEGWCKILTPDTATSSDSLLIDAYGDLWVVKNRKGVLHCDQKNCELWWSFNELGPSGIAMDQQGRIWIGGWGLLSVYDPAAER